MRTVEAVGLRAGRKKEKKEKRAEDKGGEKKKSSRTSGRWAVRSHFSIHPHLALRHHHHPPSIIILPSHLPPSSLTCRSTCSHSSSPTPAVNSVFNRCSSDPHLYGPCCSLHDYRYPLSPKHSKVFFASASLFSLSLITLICAHTVPALFVTPHKFHAPLITSITHASLPYSSRPLITSLSAPTLTTHLLSSICCHHFSLVPHAHH